MGVVTLFFVAPPKELVSCDLSRGVPAGYPTEQRNFIDQLKVAGLDSVLTGKAPAQAMDILMGRCIYDNEESGISVHQLADDFVKALAALTPETAIEPALKWLKSEEWKGFGRRAGDQRDLVDMVLSISKLASTAQSGGQGMFLWVCP